MDLANIITDGMRRPVSAASCSGSDEANAALSRDRLAPASAQRSDEPRRRTARGAMRHTCRHSTLTPIVGGRAVERRRGRPPAPAAASAGSRAPADRGTISHTPGTAVTMPVSTRHGTDGADHADRRASNDRRSDLATGEARSRRPRGTRRGASRSAYQARMRRLPHESQHVPLDAVGAGDSSSRSATRFEHRSLLDVKLQVGARTTGLEGLPRLGHAVHVDAVLGQRVGRDGCPVDPSGRERCRARGCRWRRMIQQAAGESSAFLVGEIRRGPV